MPPISKTRSSKKVSAKKTVKKDVSMPPHRIAIIYALQTKYNRKTSEMYENNIYQMCKNLSEDYVESVDEIYRKYAYEKVGELLSISEETKIQSICEDLSNGVLDWDSCVYAEYREKLEKENTQIAQGIKVEKGEFTCKNRNCRSKECYYYQSQDRSSDEGMTTHVICTKCGTRFKFN